MATVSPSCAHKKAACLRCNSGVCSACCKCFKPKGRPKKRTTQEVVKLRRNTSRAVRPKPFVEPPSEFLEQEPVVSEPFEVASRCNILEIYKRMGMEDAYGDIDNLPSLKVRKSLSEKDGIDDKAFSTASASKVVRIRGKLRSASNRITGTSCKISRVAFYTMFAL